MAGLVAQALPACAAPSARSLAQQVVFTASAERGYACFRIPAIVRTTRGTLLAFAEGRIEDCGDAGDVDIVVKRSTDGGRTWGPLQVVNDGGGDTHGNPTPMVDERTGRIVLAETYNKGIHDGRNCHDPCARTPYVQYSDDDGRTWSTPKDLGGALRPARWNSWYATGPVHGIQLAHGRHAGRLVFGLNARSFADGRVTGHLAALAVSDDHGTTWRLGARQEWAVAADTTYRQEPSELSVVERADGAVYVNAREEDGTDLGHRTAAVSADGGDSFSEPFRTLPGLYTPVVQGSLLRLRSRARDGYDRLLFAAPADPDRRRWMTIRSSWDEGRTWEGADRGARVTGDWSGYSDLVNVTPRETGLLYEGGQADSREQIRFVSFTENWLGPRRGPDPTTRDRAPGAAGAAVLGGVGVAAGPFGGAAVFDGVDDAIRLPFRSSLCLGAGDFTVSLWFRYTATSGEQPLLWMGGVGTTSPQVALRALPGSGRIEGLMTARQGGLPATTATVTVPDAHNDGRWHHLSLRRSGGRLALAVDGGTPGSGADVPGSVSRNDVFGVHLGQRPDGTAQFAGALDEVRVYRRALSDAELARVRQRNARVPGPVALDLPLSRISGVSWTS
ncbi:exo-alpha-sialidase [Streptomyces sp. NPDC059740]|uniref:exo-alpha-sialidase n=1 Tax=Streptomyces sp. NPDC059740 TaxID=3346926 RepID=UPI00365F7842